MLQEKHANEATARLDQALAAVFADAIAHRRQTQERQRPPSMWRPTVPIADARTLADELLEAAYAQFSGSRRELMVSNKDLEAMVSSRLEGLRTDALQGLLVVFGLPQRPEDPTDAFDKLQMISREFAQSLETKVDEPQVRAFLQIALRGSDDTLDAQLQYAHKVLRGVPHLYVLDQDRRLRFRLGRVAASYVRILVLLYHFKLDVMAEDAVTTALADVVLVVRILTQCIITQFPVLGTAILASSEDERHLDAQPGNRPLNEKASLVCRCVVEEAVAAPLFRGVVAPLYAASEKFLTEDRRIAKAAARIVARGDPHELLRRLQASEDFVLSTCKTPYAAVVEILKQVWDPASPMGSGPTSKARLLVRASRTIPLAISQAGQHGKHEIGADDLLPIFCFATIWSQPRNLASLTHYLEHCVAQSLLTSEAGYALALLQTALQTIPTLDAESSVKI
ncbi:Hypothetical Protein FCC1311_088232 [Hondaea fermentalgiana]|uniref:VPS9 domain-containing protein n=1 Tax=Hondaea fermentalgiana TaxID=2315210 RepID=A0A2R5GS62_9STRA|nr:Hypothetical Protein FCC1311_088232 [Hondaea fermentalgiana]|eukprot:GBG32598.1 Hypothetical Protein FCC1311_088232 [Hondaea fermentalgiana]